MVFPCFANANASSEKNTDANTLSLVDGSSLSIIDSEFGKIVLGTAERTTLKTFLENFKFKESISATDDGGENLSSDFIGTGAKLKFGNDEAFVVVKGDVDGDGIVTSTDYSRIKSFFYGIYS